MTGFEVHDEDRTDGIVERIVQRLDTEDLWLDDREWRATWASPYALTLQRWESDERDDPTGPTVTVTFTVHIEDTEEGEPTMDDLAPLFATPQITTDDDGRHWHNGREYDAVTVDGELAYTPKPDMEEAQPSADMAQPDPQVAAWMRDYQSGRPGLSVKELCSAFYREAIYKQPWRERFPDLAARDRGWTGVAIVRLSAEAVID